MGERFFTFFIGGPCAIGALWFFICGWHDPSSLPGETYFRIGYALRGAEFLRRYRSYLGTRAFQRMPPAANSFLTGRLKKVYGTSEWDEILGFYLSISTKKTAGAFSGADNDLKRELFTWLVGSSGPIDGNKICMIENLRTGCYIGKTSGIRGRSNRSAYLFSPIWEADPQAGIATAYRSWWGDGSQWPANKDQDPLADTPVEFGCNDP